jgi:hypothetical protein
MNPKLDNLKKIDFEFIELFCKKYKIREGIGIQNVLGMFLAEYKQENRK